ncbi:MAG: phage late control D family protein [Deltaproteobacteria bacterium]|nr:MAG: phage late control D family protein [Deltaproteobacteria bacterium]
MNEATKRGISVNRPAAASYTVEVSGLGTATQDDPSELERFVVETHLDKIGFAQITYSGHLKPSDVSIGGDVKISVGGAKETTFKGVVTGLRLRKAAGHVTVTVEAMDPLVKLAASRRTKYWGGEPDDEVMDSDLVSEVISDGGCTEGNVESTPGGRPYVLQRNESNLAFLKRLAARNGFLLYAEDGKVNFEKPQFSASPQEIKGADVQQLDFTRSDVDVPPSVHVTGWDYIGKSVVHGEFGSSSIEKIGGEGPASAVTYSAQTHISDVFVDSDSSAKAMAEAEMNRLARSFVRGTCTTTGNGAVKIGGKVQFQGLYSDFNPEGLVVGVRHVMEPGSGFVTMFWFVGNTEPK